MKKINEKMYYVFEVEEVVQNIEPFEQYETFGEDLHHVIVKRKPILVTKQEDGKYITKDGQLVVVEEDLEKFSRSYRTKSSIKSSILGSGRATANDVKEFGLNPENVVVFGKKENSPFIKAGTPLGISTKHYALPVLAEKYEEEMSIVDKAKTLVGKPIILSENKEEADKQLAEIGINIGELRKESEAQQSQPI